MSRTPRPKLLGTYTPPPVRVGDVVTCLFRDADCVVTGFQAGPIPWPRVRARDSRGGSGLWVCDELARAVRTESAGAVAYWFGVGPGAVWRWRRAFGVGGTATTPGSAEAHKGACAAGAAKRCGTRPPPRWTVTGWTAEQLAMLGTDTDAAVAARVGRTAEAVRCRRTKLRIPTFRDRRRKD